MFIYIYLYILYYILYICIFPNSKMANLEGFTMFEGPIGISGNHGSDSDFWRQDSGNHDPVTRSWRSTLALAIRFLTPSRLTRTGIPAAHVDVYVFHYTY